MENYISNIIYYSDKCEQSVELLNHLVTNKKIDHFYYICIDNQVVIDNKPYITFSNNMRLIKPNTITTTPSIMKMGNNYEIISGDAIYDYIKSFQSKTDLPTYGNAPPMPDTNRGKVENDMSRFY